MTSSFYVPLPPGGCHYCRQVTGTEQRITSWGHDITACQECHTMAGARAPKPAATPRRGTPEERAAKVIYTRQWRASRAAGHEHRVDGLPVARHITTLLEAGWTYTSIAEAAGVAVNTVRRTHQRLVKRPHAPSAEAILAITLPTRQEIVVGEVEHLIGTRTPQAIAEAVGYAKADNLARALYRWGRPDLAKVIDSKAAAA